MKSETKLPPPHPDSVRGEGVPFVVGWKNHYRHLEAPPFEALVGDLKGSYFRRIHIQHRLVYQVDETEKVVQVLRLCTHCV